MGQSKGGTDILPARESESLFILGMASMHSSTTEWGTGRV